MNNARYDLAVYNDMTMPEKDLFWIEEIGKFHDEVSVYARTKFSHTSRCIKAYIEATDEEKKTLWDLYDPLSRRWCDYEKWKRLYPDKNI
jgi:hypothetical protein